MSLKALPVLFINLSGEMMYILDQRLKAQNISADKSAKVVNDIVSTMFNKQFVEELFKPQEVYSKQALRTVFEKLAHSSIMRLNANSMDKLYDLMTMVFKYQISLCSYPEEILFITLNHLDAIRKYTQSSPEVLSIVNNVYLLLLKNYQQLTSGELQLLRYTLLSFFQDLQIRVSVFLKDGSQHSSGRFVLNRGGPVPPGVKVPGTIREFDTRGQVVSCTDFQLEENYCDSLPQGSFDTDGQRGTNLGKNIYCSSQNQTSDGGTINKNEVSPEEDIKQTESVTYDPAAWEELSFLARLIGKTEIKNSKPEFTLGIFDDELDTVASPQGILTSEGHTVLNIDAAKPKQQMELNKILNELTVEDKGPDTSDILELLDVASM